MWILFVLVIGYHDNNSQIAVEFNTKEACMEAANSWQRQAFGVRREQMKIRTLCAFKGEKVKEGK